MGANGKRSARLSVDLEPELRRMVKVAAAAGGVSMRKYVDAALRRALELEGTFDADQRNLTLPAQISETEQQRGFSALDDLERTRNQIMDRHGRLSPESWELLSASRNERNTELIEARQE